MFYYWIQKGLCLLLFLRRTFSTHLYLCDFHPFHDGKFSKATPTEFSFSQYRKRYHHIVVMSPWAAAAEVWVKAIIRSHKHIHRQLLQDHPIFPSWFLVYVMWKFFLSLCVVRAFVSLHTFLSEDDLVVSLLAVIRSGYPVFFKTTAKVFYIQCVLLPYFRKKKKNSREKFSSWL